MATGAHPPHQLKATAASQRLFAVPKNSPAMLPYVLSVFCRAQVAVEAGCRRQHRMQNSTLSGQPWSRLKKGRLLGKVATDGQRLPITPQPHPPSLTHTLPHPPARLHPNTPLLTERAAAQPSQKTHQMASMTRATMPFICKCIRWERLLSVRA